jgi:organic radical activating enzyme
MTQEYTESSREKKLLVYNKTRWQEVIAKPINTLQLFITNRCNLRCKGCFYHKRLGKSDMSFEYYQSYIERYSSEINKIILLGGEPTIHPELEKMLDFNRSIGFKTTIYTNGFDLKRLESINLDKVSVRAGVYGAYQSEKPIKNVDKTSIPLDIVYMLRRDNTSELMETAKIAERDFNCKGFYISSIREIDKTLSFWKDTSETLPIEDFASVIQNFVNNYTGNIPLIHIARRGVLYTGNEKEKACKCRFGNIFPDGEKVICPFDISINITSPDLVFDKRPCNKHSECILRKIVLKRI